MAETNQTRRPWERLGIGAKVEEDRLPRTKTAILKTVSHSREAEKNSSQMPAKRKNLKIPLKVFLTDNYSRFASKFPFLKERQIKAKLHEAWRKQCQTLEGREADTPKIEKRRIETISLLSEGKANFKPINFFPCNITLRSGETLSLIIQAYNKSAMSFAKMEDLYKQIRHLKIQTWH